MQKLPGPVVAGALAVFVLWLLPAGWTAPQRPVAPASGPGRYRILFGLDRAERRWDGRVEVAGGAVRKLTGWHFGPDDQVRSETEWTCGSRPRAFNPAMRESPDPAAQPVGVLVEAEGPRVEVRTVSGSFGFAPSDIPAAGPRFFLEGRAAVERVPAVERHAAPDTEDDYPVLAREPSGPGVWLVWQTYRSENDAVWARRFDGRAWGAPMTVAEKGDIHRVAAATAGNGETWVVWSEQRAGNWDLYGRAHRDGKWGAETRLTEAPQPDIFHRLARDAAGNLWLVWQGARDSQFDILVRRYDGRAWGPEQNLSNTPQNDWEPAIAADAKGNVWVAWDGYESGNYDIYYTRLEGGRWTKPVPVAASANFEAHVSLAVDGSGRLWAAWDEGGRNWGKDTGFAIRAGGEAGTGLYAERRLKIARLEGGRWTQPPALPPAPDFRDRPQLAAEDSGRIWLAWRERYRLRLGIGMGGAAGAGAAETYVASWQGDRWTPPQFIPESVGRMDTRIDLAPAAGGGLWLAQATDHRPYASNRPGNYDLITARLSAPPSPAGVREAAFGPLQIDAAEAPLSGAGERADIEAIRAWRAGKRRIVRGDMHRHTDISFGDGAGDGSLTDAYRYAIDAAGFDYLAVTDHTYGDNEYSWWRTQKSADVFRLGDRFIPLYAYERSVVYPNGHRNVVHARRGVRWFPIPEAERKGAEGAARLYQYLKATGGIAMSHTSATNMGTDWRDNEPEAEPLVEIYQGDRTNYEYEGAPRSAIGSRPDYQPGGYRPAGYVRNAWAKGHRLGVQASSDHLSTHISYAMLLVDEFTREGMLDAIRRRHAYGATDNILLDVTVETPSGERWTQGDIFYSAPQPRMRLFVRGTATIERVDVIKNNNIVYTNNPGCQICKVEYTDYDPDGAMGAIASESFYYVRVRQFDGQLAWSSPVWVRRK